VRRGLILVGVVAVMLVVAPVAHAAVTAVAGDGTVSADGSATVPVTFSCTPGSVVIEAHLTLSQDDQRVSGTAGIPGVRCTGKPRTLLVRVVPVDGAFHPGAAFASPFLLVQNRRTGTTESGGTGATITLR
jgi:hypothetical protein